LIASVTDEDIQKAPVGSRILAVCQLADKEAAARGDIPDTSRPLVVVVRGDNARVQVNSTPQPAIEQKAQVPEIAGNDIVDV
jgi:hypothetical protein